MLICPDCKAPQLENTHSLELGPDGDSDEVSLSALRCRHCGMTAAGSYEESRRGRLDHECWNHTCVRVTQTTYDQLVASLSGCPDPTDYHCGCNAHRFFGVRTPMGSKQPLAHVPGVGLGFEPELGR
jgi:hypothetical protein